MTAAETWEPGDPFMPDNGCGTVPTINWTTEERHQAIAEDTQEPPWFRPLNATVSGPGWNHHCKSCNVQWRSDSDEPCWMCGGEEPTA